MELNDLLSYMEENTPAGTNLQVVMPYEKVTLVVDALPEKHFIYLKEHQFCLESRFDYVSEGVVVNASLTFLVSGKEQFFFTT